MTTISDQRHRPHHRRLHRHWRDLRRPPCRPWLQSHPRRPQQGKLQALAAQISDKTGRAVEVLAADLGDKADLARVEQVLREDASITALVNNAGIGTHSALLESDVEKMDAMVQLNVTALMRLTYAAVPGLVARGGGTVINIASIVAVAPELLNGVYGGTKAFVQAFTTSLNHELADKGIRSGRAAGRHPHRFLGAGRVAGRASARRDRDGCGRYGRCRAGRPRSGEISTIPRCAMSNSGTRLNRPPRARPQLSATTAAPRAFTWRPDPSPKNKGQIS
jgi:NAD(P)-dependent dehydrogenase (short-subunit alcohol dehydrogenase family)